MWVAWVKWERDFMSGMGRMGYVGPQNLARVKENGRVEILVWVEKCLYELLLRLYEVLILILVSLFPKIKRLHQHVKTLLNYV